MLGNKTVTLGNIANYPIAGKRSSILRFKADKTGIPNRFNWWWRAEPFGRSTGYSRGDGGIYRGQLQGDNALGQPDGLTIAEFEFHVDLMNFKPTALNQYRPAWFKAFGKIEAGKTYNLVVTNIHQLPNQNYCSLNGVYSRDQSYDGHGFEINEAAPLKGFKRHSGTFAYMPGWAITLDDGRQLGNPWQYGEAHTARHQIGGHHQVRQLLTARHDMQLDRLHVFATRIRGGSSLYANLFVDGIYQNRIRFSSSQIPVLQTRSMAGKAGDFQNYRWRTRRIDIDLSAGQQLTVQLYTLAGSQYYVPCSIKAGKYTGIDANQLADKGHAEFSTDGGQSWEDFHLINPKGAPRDKMMLSVFAD